MNISELSIRRPVLSTVLTLIILLFGLIGYSYLGVREYPSVDNPIISVSCSYPGAMKNGIRLWLSLSIHVIIIMFVMVFITGTLSFRFFSSDIHSVTARLFPLISLLIAAC